MSMTCIYLYDYSKAVLRKQVVSVQNGDIQIRCYNLGYDRFTNGRDAYKDESEFLLMTHIYTSFKLSFYMFIRALS